MNLPCESLLKKDFCKLDVCRFNIEHIVGDIYDICLMNSISWDVMNLRVTKSELVGLVDFILNHLDNQNEN